tara:strand:+ start:2636 stop:5035 length:2400 start_codon:yes stop_codon:yes gene_type:complete
MFKFKILCFISLFSSLSLNAQNCNNIFNGRVLDLHDNSPLSGAAISVMGVYESFTDNNGFFTINNLCNQNYTFEISHPLCDRKEFDVDISKNKEKTFRLEHHIKELNEIILYGNSFEKKSKTIIENIISTETLQDYASETFGDALTSLSGVSSFNTGNSIVKPVINGLHSNRVEIINNGVRMEDQQWGVEHAPNIDINSLDKITLIKGAGALQFAGSALGGIIIGESAKLSLQDSLYVNTSIIGASNGRGSLLRSKLTQSHANGLYYTLNTSLKRFGDYSAPNYIMRNTGVNQKNLSLKLGLNRVNFGFEFLYSFFNNEIGILRSSHVHTPQDQVRAINSDFPLFTGDFKYEIEAPKQDVKHQILRLKAFKKTENIGEFSIQYDFQRNNRFEYDIRLGDDKFKPSTDLELETHTLSIDLKSEIKERIKLKVGLTGRYQKNFPDPVTGVRRIIPDYKKYDFGIYAISDYRINEKWLIESGIRFDHTLMDVYKFYRTSFWVSRNYDQLFPELVIREVNSQTLINTKLNYNNISATLGAKNNSNNYTSFLNYSVASRAPNPSELFSEGLHHSAARIELGDLRFKSEIGHKLSYTLQRNEETFTISINPYYNLINDFLILEPSSVQTSIRGTYQVWTYRQTNANLFGLDIDATIALSKKISYGHKSSIVKSYDRILKIPLINMPPVNTQNEIIYENRNFKNFKIKLTSNYVFRQNEYPDNNFEVFIATSQLYETVDISSPPDHYHLINFNSSIDLKNKNSKRLSLSLKINNLLNNSYRNYLNRMRYYSHELGRNIIIGLNYNF